MFSLFAIFLFIFPQTYLRSDSEIYLSKLKELFILTKPIYRRDLM